MENSKNGCGAKKIQGIKCEVTNCVYHAPEHGCNAGCITVGPGPCSACSDTNCSTFKAK
ncbi:MAG TPA: DUF1540 domain-containing protein [Firmicutes bacterium]|nr:DUF1540 domain-containing protein [Bacillota bacterium]